MALLAGVREQRSSDGAGEPPSEDRTLFRVDKATGTFGAEIYRIERRAPVWVSQYRTFPGAPQGDPRWMVRVLGEQAAAFFGYRIVDDAHMWIPSEQELNRAVAYFNRFRPVGVDPIGLGFYSPNQGEIIAPLKYLTEFAAGLRLPISRAGVTQLHDLSFHAPFLVAPLEILKLLQLQTQFFLRFVAYAEPQLLARELAPAYDALLERRVKDIDFGTGNFTIGFLEHFDLGLMFLRLNELTRAFASPVEALTQIIAEVVHRDPHFVPLEDLLRQFQTDPSNRSLGYAESLLSMNKSDVCAAFSGRIAELREVIDGFERLSSIEPLAAAGVP